MPAKFQKFGIAFQYPGNWSLDEEAFAERKSVTVYSPGGAFWSVSIHPYWSLPGELADAAVKAIQEEYKESEVEEAHGQLAGRELSGYDMSFYYLDLINTATIRCLRTEDATYTVFCQGEDRDFDQLRMVFDAITTSFLNSLGTLDPQDRGSAGPIL